MLQQKQHLIARHLSAVIVILQICQLLILNFWNFRSHAMQLKLTCNWFSHRFFIIQFRICHKLTIQKVLGNCILYGWFFCPAMKFCIICYLQLLVLKHTKGLPQISEFSITTTSMRTLNNSNFYLILYDHHVYLQLLLTWFNVFFRSLSNMLIVLCYVLYLLALSRCALILHQYLLCSYGYRCKLY